ncbi:hypothetical protein Mlab_1646 [Methanocorpusculum labreanum Z]|uniref:Uncharacterized protein n=1 Tax=Methanocorpusculum labreanum (strain ATCC 43576 / DSM 4855 / Z) TaxID=410358 RepID=A2SU01_METLZ|nr:hypothetical protein [Methanocorpusculum labreanum]ABN07807.1 hypothetical protein Mlab_1646 [Methanocorpusculum labreanum Z]
MDPIVEQGFDRLLDIIKETKAKQQETSELIIHEDKVLLEKMLSAVVPVVEAAGSLFLEKAKQDTKGDLYDQKYYPEKMIILGKTESPASFRPDDPKKKVTQQFCVASEKGELFELMFSNDGFVVDTYASPLSAEDALDFYGYDILYMLYSAIREYALAEEDVLEALSLTLGYLQQKSD